MTFDNELEFFLSKFSHELRNPLTAVYSTLQLMESQHPEVKEFKYWSCLASDIEYMNRLLADLSNFSKSEKLQTELFALDELLKEISLSFAASVVNSKVEYTSKISPSVGQITGDKTKLQEVFLNLLKNAYDAACPNKTVFLDASTVGESVVISVRDTGCGISEEQLSTIFEPFVTYKKNGTGLGLPICDHIIKAHGGTITVTSTVGVGTIFEVTLPKLFSSLQ